MARISGVDLPREKRIEIGLTYIYGIGLATSKKVLAAAGVNPDTRVRDLTDDEVRKLSDVINETLTVEVIFVERQHLILRDFRKLVVSAESVTERDFRFVDSTQRTMLVHVRDQRRRLLTRRSNLIWRNI